MRDKKDGVLVSIIVPVYNVAPYIYECIKSIQKQTYHNIEIIIIDDGSIDDTGEICERLATCDGRIHLIHQKNSGVVVARSRGIKVSTGKYLAFVDGDDWIEPNMIEELLKQIGDSMLVTSGAYMYLESGEVAEIKDDFPEGEYSGDVGISTIFKRMIYDENQDKMQNFICSCWNKLYIRELVEEVHQEVSIGIAFAEDFVFTYKYLLRCNSIKICHKCLYHYRWRQESAIHAVNPHRLMDINKVYLSLEKDFRKHRLRETLLYQLQMWVTHTSCKSINERMGFDTRVHIPEFIVDLSGLEGKNLIVYGAGRVGKEIYIQLKKFEYQIVAWVDKNYTFYQDKGLLVISPEEMIHCEYDLLLIAVHSETLAETLKEELQERGISRTKLVWRKPIKVY